VNLPPERVKIYHAFAHMRLAHDPAVYAQIRAWLEAHGE
jgi:hypothetical protein